MRLPPSTELGEKHAFSFSLAHTHSNCPSPPYSPILPYSCKSMYYHRCNAPSKCVFFQVLSFQAKILLPWGGSFSAGSRDTEPQVADSQMDQSWVPSRCSEGQLLTCVGCLFHAVQLNPEKKGVLLAKNGLFSLGRDWKDALLLSDTKRKDRDRRANEYMAPPSRKQGKICWSYLLLSVSHTALTYETYKNFNS